MAQDLREFLASAMFTAAENLETALKRIPEDKWTWSPADSARSAIDMVAECAILNGSAAGIIRTGKWPEDFDFQAFLNQKVELASDWPRLKAMLDSNTALTVQAIRDLSDKDLETEVKFPSSTLTMAQVLAYPYWNMSYHEGQINYIASILGCLK